MGQVESDLILTTVSKASLAGPHRGSAAGKSGPLSLPLRVRVGGAGSGPWEVGPLTQSGLRLVGRPAVSLSYFLNTPSWPL